MSVSVVPDASEKNADSLFLTQFANQLRPQTGVKQSNYVRFANQIKENFDQAAAAQDMIKRLKEMEKLNNRGNMGSPLIASALKRFGVDFPSLFTADSQQFEKLSIDMTKFAKASFGNKLSRDVVNLFLQSIPRRTMSTEARKRVIESLIQFAKPAIDRKNDLLRIRRENNGQLPDDFMFQLEEKSMEREAKANDKIAKMSEMKPDENEKTPGLNQLPDASQAKGYIFEDSSILDKNGQPAYRYSDGKTWGVMSPEEAAKYVANQTDQEPTLMDKVSKKKEPEMQPEPNMEREPNMGAMM